MNEERKTMLESRNQLTHAGEDGGKLHGGIPGVLGAVFSSLSIDAPTFLRLPSQQSNLLFHPWKRSRSLRCIPLSLFLPRFSKKKKTTSFQMDAKTKVSYSYNLPTSSFLIIFFETTIP